MCKRVSAIATIVGVLVGGVLGSAMSRCQAQVVGTFEHNLSSSVGATWEGDGIVNSEYVSTGATDGTSSLAIHHPGADAWAIQAILKGGLPLAQLVATHDFLLIDVTTTDSGIAGDGWSPAYRNIIPVINSNKGGWQQNQINYPVASDDGGTLTTTVILDLNTVASTDPNPISMKANAQAFVDSGGGQGTWFELFLPMQGRDQGTVVRAGDYNNEPASIVNAADYVTWRKNLGGSTLSNETVSLGTVDSADYGEWRAHFGTDYTKITTIIDNVRFANAGAGAGLRPSGVPEPASALLLLTSALALAAFRRRSA